MPPKKVTEVRRSKRTQVTSTAESSDPSSNTNATEDKDHANTERGRDDNTCADVRAEEKQSAAETRSMNVAALAEDKDAKATADAEYFRRTQEEDIVDYEEDLDVVNRTASSAQGGHPQVTQVTEVRKQITTRVSHLISRYAELLGVSRNSRWVIFLNLNSNLA